MTRLQKNVSVFQGGQMTLLALACGRPWLSVIDAHHHLNSATDWAVGRCPYWRQYRHNV